MKRQTIEKINAVKAALSEYLHQDDSYVKNIGKMFFINGMDSCVMRDVVYYRGQHIELDFELLSMDWRYFVGSKKKAMALKEYFGGNVFMTEYACLDEDARDLYSWEAPKEVETLDYDEVVNVLFS